MFTLKNLEINYDFFFWDPSTLSLFFSSWIRAFKCRKLKYRLPNDFPFCDDSGFIGERGKSFFFNPISWVCSSFACVSNKKCYKSVIIAIKKIPRRKHTKNSLRYGCFGMELEKFSEAHERNQRNDLFQPEIRYTDTSFLIFRQWDPRNGILAYPTCLTTYNKQSALASQNKAANQNKPPSQQQIVEQSHVCIPVVDM